MPIACFSVSWSPFVLFALKSSPRFLPFNLTPDGIRDIAQSGALGMHSKLCCRPVLV